MNFYLILLIDDKFTSYLAIKYLFIVSSASMVQMSVFPQIFMLKF